MSGASARYSCLHAPVETVTPPCVRRSQFHSASGVCESAPKAPYPLAPSSFPIRSARLRIGGERPMMFAFLSNAKSMLRVRKERWWTKPAPFRFRGLRKCPESSTSAVSVFLSDPKRKASDRWRTMENAGSLSVRVDPLIDPDVPACRSVGRWGHRALRKSLKPLRSGEDME